MMDKYYLKVEQTDEIGLAKGKLEVRDITGKKHTKVYEIPYASEKVDSSQVLRDLRKHVKKQIRENEYLLQFDEDILTDKVVSLSLTRAGERYE